VAFIGAAVIAIGNIGVAFGVAPRACKGGFEIYFWFGCASLLVLAALPFVAHVGRSWAMRVAWAMGFLAFGAAAWLAGLLGANVRFICGLGYL
jgi:hypothetical protein